MAAIERIETPISMRIGRRMASAAKICLMSVALVLVLRFYLTVCHTARGF